VWRSNWQRKWPCQIDREPWEHIHAGMCMHAEMAETRRRRGWRLRFVFVSLVFLFCTTTCQVDRERSARVCVKRSNWRRKCRSIVCVWEVGVYEEGRRANCFFSFVKFLWERAERWSSLWGAAGSFVLKFSKGWSSLRKVETVVEAWSIWRR
jgi:hypothetical protein